MSIDHNHKNGKIRGLLCFRCNFGLTYFGEDYILLKKAYEHIKKGGMDPSMINNEVVDEYYGKEVKNND